MAGHGAQSLAIGHPLWTECAPTAWSHTRGLLDRGELCLKLWALNAMGTYI